MAGSIDLSSPGNDAARKTPGSVPADAKPIIRQVAEMLWESSWGTWAHGDMVAKMSDLTFRPTCRWKVSYWISAAYLGCTALGVAQAEAQELRPGLKPDISGRSARSGRRNSVEGAKPLQPGILPPTSCDQSDLCLKFLDEGRQAFTARNPSQALKAYEQAFAATAQQDLSLLKEAGRVLHVMDYKEQAADVYRRYLEKAPSEDEDTQTVLLWFQQVLTALPSSPVSPEPVVPLTPRPVLDSSTTPLHFVAPLAVPPLEVHPIRLSQWALAPLARDLPHPSPVSVRLSRLGIASGILGGVTLMFSAMALALGLDGSRDFGSCQSFTAMDCQPHTLPAAVTGFVLTGIGLTGAITLAELSTKY